MTPRTTPLHERHLAAEAKMVNFGGWSMPIAYPAGTLAEHRACREDAVVFDVSHLGTVRVEGDGAHALLQRTLSNDLDRIGPGRAQYTHLLDEQDATVLDDIIVWWRADGVFDVMPNASNTERVVEALSEGTVRAADVTHERAVLAVQGPAARRRLAELSPAAAEVGRFRVAEVRIGGVSCTVAGTGYTGEDGVEISVPADDAGALWDDVVATGITPAGLGARDTLRLEAGLPLHGCELGPGITPLQARLGWVVAWNKGPFRGRDALAAERERGPAALMIGVATDGRRPPRADAPIRRDGERVGRITSGNFSPMLGHGIGLALVAPGIEIGDELVAEVRGSEVPLRVVPTPFWPPPAT